MAHVSSTSVPIPTTAVTRWQDAINRLDPDTKASLANVATRKLDILHLVIKTANEKRNICIAKQWKLKTSSGKVIILRDVLEKIAGWINRLVAVGDTIIQYDPSHAALPWAAFRFLLNIAVVDVQIWGNMLVNLEIIARLLCRCEILENMHLKRPFTMLAHFQEAVTQIYVDVLNFLSKSVYYFKQSFAERTIRGAIRPDAKSPEMTAVLSQEREVSNWITLSDSEVLQSTNNQTLSMSDKLAAISRMLDDDIPRLIDTSLAIRQFIDEKKTSNIISWLSTVPTALHLKEIASRRMPGSGSWVLKDADFHTWNSSSSSAILLLHGVRGCGKSTIASFVVDHFQRPSNIPAASPATCAYFFCDDSDAEPERGNATSILRGLIRQLAVSPVSRSIDQALLLLYERRLEASQNIRMDVPRLNIEECFSTLLDLTATNPAYIVIDAIDQLGQDERAALVETMKKLIDQSASITKVFFTSCNNAHIEGLLLHTPKLRITSELIQTELKDFVNCQVEKANARRRILNGAATTDLLDTIKEHLTSRAGEMFLWVDLQLENLCRKKTEHDLVSALEGNFTADLDHIYGRTLHHFNKLDPIATQAVIHVFSLLLYARRPLHPAVIEHSIALNQSLANAGVMDIEDLCCSLVTFDVQHGVARFCHPSVRDYMRRQELFSAKTAHQILTKICLLECCSGPSSTPFASDETPVRDFYHYAAVHWPEHLQECEALGSDDILKNARLFIAGPDDGFVSPVFCTWMDWIAKVCHDLPLYHHTRNIFEHTLNDSYSPLFVICVFGLRGLLLYVLDVFSALDIDQKSTTGHTAIYLASSYGHEDVVNILIDHNANFNLECGAFGTITRVACFRGHLKVVQNLLGRIDELESPKSLSRAYKAACLGGHTEVALFLAKNCKAARSADGHSTMLQDTIEAGFPKVLEWLTKPSTLKSWALPNLAVDTQKALVTVAIKQGQVAVLRSLLEKQPHLMKALPKDCIPIAATSGHPAMVEYLHNIGANLDEQGDFGSALRSASLVGCEPVVRMLIGRGVDVGLCGTQGDALQAASINGHVKVMELLIQGGADINQVGKPWGNCLQAAAWFGHMEAVELLLSHGADVYQKGHSRDALYAAIESGHEEIAKLLLAKGYQPPKGTSLPAVSRGDHGSLHFPKDPNAQNSTLSKVAQEEDYTSSDTFSDSETSDAEFFHDRKITRDDINDFGENAELDYGRAHHDDFAKEGQNIELSAIAGDSQSLRFYLLRGKFYDGQISGAIEAAASHGQLETLDLLVNKGISRKYMSNPDFEITKAMTTAASNGQSAALQLLGDASKWKYMQSPKRWRSPFEAAIESGDLACVSLLLEHHPPPGREFMLELSKVFDTVTKKRNHLIARFLLSWLQNHSGLENPAISMDTSIMKIPTVSTAMASFLKTYLNPNVRMSKKAEDSSHVLLSFAAAATATGDIDLLKFFLVKAKSRGYMNYREPSKFVDDVFLSTCLHHVRGMELFFGCGLDEICFPQQLICQGIHDAALEGKATMITYLAKRISSAVSQENRSKLYDAFLAGCCAGHSRAVHSMLDLASFWNGIGDTNKKTILTRGLVMAAEHGRRKVSELLLKHGADVNLCVQEVPKPKVSERERPSIAALFEDRLPPAWEHAFRRRQKRTIRLSSRPISPLQAAIRGFETIASHEVSEHGEPRSFVRLSRELESIIRTLIDLGCDPDDQGGQPMYPIQYAARWANERVIQILLDGGAEPTRFNEDDEDEESRRHWSRGEQSCHPILLAAERNCRFAYSIIAILLKGGATLPSTRQGQVHPAVRMSLIRPIMWHRRPKMLPFGSDSCEFRDPEYKTETLSIEQARQLFNDGMRTLLTELFKRLPQQRADKHEFYTLLTSASTAGDRVSVKLLLKHGASVNHSGRNIVFDTPLGCASLHGHIHIMKEILKAGADPECKGFVDCPQDAMIKAVIGGHTAAVRLLIESGAQRVRNKGRSFLLAAARTRNAEMVQCLLQMKFPLNEGPNALLFACASGETSIVTSLLSSGISPDTPGRLDFNSPSRVKSTPLNQASRRGHLKIVQELLKHGANPMNSVEEGLQVPLVIAANKGHLEIVRALLEHESMKSINKTSYSSNLSDAIAKTCTDIWSPAKTTILELLLEVASQRSDFESIWRKAISDESLSHHAELIKLLLEFVPPSPEMLVLAASCGSTEAAQRCLARGIDPNSQSQHDHLPLPSASRKLNKSLVQLLISHGAAVNRGHVRGQTLLLWALEGFKVSLAAPTSSISHGRYALDAEDTIRCLLNAGAKVEFDDSPKILEVACSLGHAGIVALLLAHREPDSSNTGLQSGLFAAIDNDSPENTSLLLQIGTDPNQIRPLRSVDTRAKYLTQTGAAIEQTPLEAACGKPSDCLMRTFLGSAIDLRISSRVLTTAARSSIDQDLPEHSTDLALILEHDASLIVSDSVLEILAAGHQDKLLKSVLPRSRCSDPSRFEAWPRSVIPRAPPILSQMPADVLRRR